MLRNTPTSMAAAAAKTVNFLHLSLSRVRCISISFSFSVKKNFIYFLVQFLFAFLIPVPCTSSSVHVCVCVFDSAKLIYRFYCYFCIISSVLCVFVLDWQERAGVHTRFSVATNTRLIVRNHCVGAANAIDFDFALAYCHVHSYFILVLYFAIHYTIGYAD